MEFFQDIAEYAYLSNAFWASILSGITCSLIGCYVVFRRMVFLAGGITHASFGGLGIACYLGLNPLWGASLFALLSAWGIEWMGEKERIREDSAIGITWSVGMAIGALFLALRPGYTSGDLSSFLFGSIITVTSGDVRALALLTLLVVVAALVWMRPIIYTAFDREYAESQGVRVRRISYLMAAVLALAIVLSIRIMGIVLLLSLLTLPAAIANSWSRDYRTIARLAPPVGVVGNVLGLMLSYYAEVPPGAAIIFLLTLMLLMARGARLIHLKMKHCER